MGILFRRIKVDAADRVLHIELVLEAIGDLFRRRHYEQVVGYFFRMCWAETDTAASQEVPLRLARPICPRANILLVILLVLFRGLIPPVIEQFTQRLADSRILVKWKDNAPARLGKVFGIDTFRPVVITFLRLSLLPSQFI